MNQFTYKPFPADVKEALTIALRSEIMAAKLYEKIAESTRDSQVKETALMLVKQELEHKKTLEALYHKKFGKTAGISDTFPGATGEDSIPSLDVRGLMEEALKRERDSYLFYVSLHQSSNDEEVRGILSQLADAEKGHQAVLEKMI